MVTIILAGFSSRAFRAGKTPTSRACLRLFQWRPTTDRILYVLSGSAVRPKGMLVFVAYNYWAYPKYQTPVNRPVHCYLHFCEI